MIAQPSPVQPDSELLQAAFRSFDGAALTLQQSYRALTSRLEQLDLELADRNEALRCNLRTNEELREHLSAILESLSTGILVTDEQGTVTRCNKAGEHLMGTTRDRIVGRPLDACLRDARLDSGEYPLTTKSGAVATISQKPLNDAAGRPTGRLTLIDDITTVHQLEERLQRRNRLAAMGEMVGRIAHEIRNPLGSIELFASMLRRDLKEDGGLRGYADHICSAVQLLDRLLSNLLLYTKPDCSRGAWHQTESVILDALALAAHAVAKARLEIRLHVDQAASRLWCDAGQLKQALLNLILNGVQAMPDGGALTLSAVAEPGADHGLRLSVSDTGVGIPAALRARIFDPFFTTKEEGTGLGLAIVHAIIEGHRGRIDVASTPGQGSTFTMVLPNLEPDPQAAGHGSKPEKDQPLTEETPA